jgi:hypothetical protein
VIIGPRTEAAFLTVVGVAVAVSYVWWHQLWLPFIGVFIAGFRTSALIGDPRAADSARAERNDSPPVDAAAQGARDTVLVDP